MHDAGQFGPLLSNRTGASAPGRPIPGRSEQSAGEDADASGFGEIFDASGERRGDVEGNVAAVESNRAVKDGDGLGNDQQALVADFPTKTLARDASANEILRFNIPFPGGERAGHEDVFQYLRTRINDGDVSKFATLPDNLLNGRFRALKAGPGDFRGVLSSAASTVKLAEARNTIPDTQLATIKVGQASAPSGGVPFNLDGLAQFTGAPPELSPRAEGFTEFRSPLSESGPVAFRSATVAPPGATDAYNILATSFSGPLGGPSAAGEIDILGDLALATSGGSTRATGTPAIFAPSTAHSFTGHAGVLPQIQAAVIAGMGRDTVEVRLDPPDLGRVRIDFSVEGGDAIKAIIGAERSETLDHLRRNIADLEQQLRQAGFGSISFEFRNGGDRHFSGDRDDPQSATSAEGAAAGDQPAKIYLTMRENAQLDLLL